MPHHSPPTSMNRLIPHNTSMNRLIPHDIIHPLALTVITLILATMLAPVHAAPITWGTATNTTGKEQLIEADSVILAFNGGSNATITAGGASGTSSYTFTGGNYQDLNYTPNPSSKTFTGASNGAASTGDTNFDAILNTVAYSSGTSGVQTITGLIDGVSYQVQVFYNDQRDGLTGRVMTYGDGEASPQNVNLTSGSGNWGQFAVGTFTAIGNTQSLTHITNGFASVHVNAILVTSAESIPLPTLSTVSNPVSATFTVDVNFTETVSGLEESDFVVSNGNVTPASLSGSGDTWSIQITPTSNGDVSITLPASSVTDTDGENNVNLASNTLETTYIAPGSDQPTPTLSTPNSVVFASYTVSINFTEAVNGLALGDFLVSNATLSNLTGSGSAYSILITPTDLGDVTLDLPKNSVTDLDGDNLMNAASNQLLTNYAAPLTVAIYGGGTTDTPEFDINLTFSEAITGLDVSDFQVTNGTVTSITALARREFADRYFTISLRADSPGQVQVLIPAGGVAATATPTLSNQASSLFSTQCSADFATVWSISDEASWTANLKTSSNLTLSNGFAEPTATNSQFSSITKTFSIKRKARSITFLQSPAWENWTASTANLGPSGAGDAPVFVPAGDNDYYFLGLGSGDVYHAWHSTDMATWVHKGPVTSGAAGRWVTSAEYKDGLFYIYSDYSNDHTPHLFIDDDLGDGVAGIHMGAAFPRAAGEHGSDCSLFRNDEDGLFHLIYEDWSPVKASSHSYDSPLAGHTTSVDGISGFVEGEHQPPIDLRTTPTGETGTYSSHPTHRTTGEQGNTIEYQIHSPEQNAYGDWTTIKVGSRFFMFCDNDPAGQSIRMGRFASDSIYGQFKYTGEMHDGHPDPSVGFAEGQFYLFTQQNTDYTSPGPWVDGVEARAGVDTDGNGTIDQWTAWQSINEQYDYTPGFIRVVTLTPAGLDLSSLPEGFGFEFEFKIDNSVVPAASPIMDRVEMTFEPNNFQQWANQEGTPADPDEDHNNNGVANIVEFALGVTQLPNLQPDAQGFLNLTITNAGVEDGNALKLEYSDDLLMWDDATAVTSPVKQVSSTTQPNGDITLQFEIKENEIAQKLFWRLKIE